MDEDYSAPCPTCGEEATQYKKSNTIGFSIMSCEICGYVFENKDPVCENCYESTENCFCDL